MAWLYKRGPIWWIGYRVNGRKIQKSTGTSDQAEAERELAKVDQLFGAKKIGMLDQLYGLLSGKSIPKVTLHAALRDWLEESEAANAQGTVEKYRSLAEGFKEYLASDLPLVEVTSEHVRTFLVHRRKNATAATVNLFRKVLSVFFTREMKNGHIQTNPCMPVKPFKAGKEETLSRRAFTLEEVQLIHRQAPDDFWRYMVMAGFFTGQRMGDLITLTWGSVDLGTNVIRLVSRKTKTKVIIPMAPQLRAIIQARMAELGGSAKPGDFAWPEQARYYLDHNSAPFSNQFYEILSRCGLATTRTASHEGTGKGRGGKREASPVSFHCLRHSFVTFLKASGAAQSTAKFLAGHASDTINDHYSHADEATLR